MALLTKVGSFTAPGATGSQAITGVGFTPKAIIFWSTTDSGSTSGTWQNWIFQLLGFTAGPTSSYCTSMSSRSGVSPAASARRAAAKAITAVLSNAVDVLLEADLTSFDSDGFTLGWTTAGTVNSSTLSGKQINYMALGGSDITNAKVIAWTGAGANGLQSVTGVGFKPDLVLHTLNGMAAGSTGSVSRCIFGAMNRQGQQWSNSTSTNSGSTTSDTSRYQQTDACILAQDVSATTIQGQANFVSMDSDGFSVNWSTFLGAPTFSLCIKGVSSKIGGFLKGGATAPSVTTVPHVGFLAKAILFSSNGTIPQPGVTANATWGLGATDLTNHRTSYFTDGDNLNPTQAQAVWYSDSAIVTHNGLGVVGGKATQVYADADHPDRFSLYFPSNDSTNSEILYLALGDAGVDTYPSMIPS